MAKKLVLIILGVILLFVGLTVYQISAIAKLVKNGEFSERLENAIEGDCSDYQAVIKEANSRVKKIKFCCINPIIAFFSSKSAPAESGLCEQIKGPNEMYGSHLEKIKNKCE